MSFPTPTVKVVLDDGTETTVKVSQGDLNRLERAMGRPVDEIGWGVEVLSRLAWLACRRTGFVVPDDYEAFIDISELDVDVTTGPKVSALDPSTG